MAKRIVFCADGTWNNEATNTNVYKIFKAMNFTAAQCPIYDDGVGSDGGALARFLGGAFGEGLDQKIKEGYTRISHLYEQGDQVFLFGFSRGAYTARSLGGMIANCGLPTQNVDDQQTELAFAAYRQRDPAQRQQQLASLKQRYAPDNAQIAMIGVWDTVGSLGLPAIFGGIDVMRYAFLDTKLHPDVKYACHAVSIDEKRREFPATLWDNPVAPDQVIEQVYFTGVHCDVGGGYPETGLSDITLGWMMTKAQAHGVDFDPAVYQFYTNLDAKHALDQKHESWSPRWAPSKLRDIDDHASVSNSVLMRLQHDASYAPLNLKHATAALAAGYGVVNVVSLPGQTSSAAGTP
ncbi:MAG: DUF2235 domain-containing protein [Candidatus Korobacteraceae bacterium]